MKQNKVSIVCSECGCDHLARIKKQAALFPVEQALICPLTGGTANIVFAQPIEFIDRPAAA